METCKLSGYALAIPRKPTAGSKRRLFWAFSRHELGLAWMDVFGIYLFLQPKCPGKNKKMPAQVSPSSCLDAWNRGGLGSTDVHTGVDGESSRSNEFGFAWLAGFRSGPWIYLSSIMVACHFPSGGRSVLGLLGHRGQNPRSRKLALRNADGIFYSSVPVCSAEGLLFQQINR